MNVKAEQLKKELDLGIKEITIDEPIDITRLRFGLMDPPAGSWNQYFTTLLFAKSECIRLGMDISTIYHCLRNDLFTMAQIKAMVGFMLPFTGEFLDYAGLRSVWAYLKRFIDLVNECEDKNDVTGVCRSLIYYVFYTHAWTHLYAPWGNGGAEYNFKPKEDIDKISKFYKKESDLKNDFPYDRGQHYQRTF